MHTPKEIEHVQNLIYKATKAQLVEEAVISAMKATWKNYTIAEACNMAIKEWDL